MVVLLLGIYVRRPDVDVFFLYGFNMRPDLDSTRTRPGDPVPLRRTECARGELVLVVS